MKDENWRTWTIGKVRFSFDFDWGYWTVGITVPYTSGFEIHLLPVILGFLWLGKWGSPREEEDDE